MVAKDPKYPKDMRTLCAIGMILLMVSMTFIPFTSNMHITPRVDAFRYTRGSKDCQDVGCKATNPGAATLYDGLLGPPTESTGSRGSVNKYAVLVGISDYPGSGNDLSFCDDDVIATKNKLVNFGWPTVNIHTLIDSQGTYQNILDELAWMKGQEDSQSQVYFHFSGHGTNGQFMVYDQMMTDNTLAGAFTGYESTQMVIVMDTCYAGTFNSLNMPGAIGLMACQSNQLSYDGMFTPTFISKLTDSSVTVEEAFNLAKSSVNSQTGGSQVPLIWDNVPGGLLLGNIPPVIGAVPSFNADEDHPIIMDLSSYESDAEDSGTALDWMVTDYDMGIIASITGENSDDDIISLIPVKDFTGTTNIELTLMDSMGQTTSKSVSVTWDPINDPPTVASLDRNTSTVKRTHTLTFKLLGDDVDDQKTLVHAEIEVSPAGSGQWEPTASSQYVSGHWEVQWIPDRFSITGRYDVRARLVDNAGATSGWLERSDLIEVQNNPPLVNSLSIPYNELERTGNMTISIYAEDTEDQPEDMILNLEYLAPGGQYTSTGSVALSADHWEVSFSPGVGAPLGWYNIRSSAIDSDGDRSPWFYQNASIEVKNSRPFVTAITPGGTTVTRGSSIYLEVNGWDPEDMNINLIIEVEYMGPDLEWVDISDVVEFSSDHWWITFAPESTHMTGEHVFRARLIDTSGAISDWYELDEPVEVLNALPVVSSFEADTINVERTGSIDVLISASDAEDPTSDLVPEAEMSIKDKGSWDSNAVSGFTWSSSQDRWTLTLSPGPHSTLGDHDLRVRFTDTEGGVGEWALMERSVHIKNGLPIIDIDVPALVNERQDTSFNGSGSYDPEGGALTFAWDFGDGSSASSEGPIHQYKTHGAYTLKLVVEDQDGAQVTETMKLDVNGLPIPKARAQQEASFGSFSVHFSSSGSSDPDGKVLTYLWDLDTSKDSNGNGDPGDDVDSKDKNPIFDYGSGGTYSYRLIIVDDEGAQSEITGHITVSSISASSAALIGGISLLMVAIAVSVLLLRRRKRLEPQKEESEGPTKIPDRAEPEDDGHSLLDIDIGPKQ